MSKLQEGILHYHYTTSVEGNTVTTNTETVLGRGQINLERYNKTLLTTLCSLYLVRVILLSQAAKSTKNKPVFKRKCQSKNVSKCVCIKLDHNEQELSGIHITQLSSTPRSTKDSWQWVCCGGPCNVSYSVPITKTDISNVAGIEIKTSLHNPAIC